MSEWQSRKLGDLARIEIGGTPSRGIPEYWANEQKTGLQWVSVADLLKNPVSETAERITPEGALSSNTKLIPAGTVLMSFKLTIGRTAYAGRDVYTNEAIAAFLDLRDELDTSYLYYVLPDAAKTAVSDTAIKGATLNKATLKSIQIQLPPVAEQRKIAAVLTTVDNLIERTEALIAKYESMKQGMMYDLFTRGVDENGRLRPPHHKAPHLYKDSPLGPIPKEWEVIQLGKAVHVQGGFSFQSSDFIQDGVPIIRMSDLNQGFLDLSGAARIPTRVADALPSFALSSGDTLVGMSGSLENYAVVRESDLPAYLNQRVGRLQLLDSNLIAYSFLRHLIRFHGYLHHVDMEAAGAAQRNISSSQIERFCFACPGIQEQTRVAGILNNQLHRIDLMKLEVSKFNRIKSGLMQDLLTGRVRVPVEETEEATDV